MKKILKMIMSIVLVLALSLVSFNTGVSAMKSSKEKVQKISTVEQLKKYLNTSKSIRLTKDLDLDNAPLEIAEYKGSFDGANHTISHVSSTMFQVNRGTIKNLVIDDSSYTDCLINTNYGTVDSVRVVNSEAVIQSQPITHKRNFRGAFVEQNNSPGVIKNCVIDVTFSFGDDVETFSTVLGGIVGFNNYGASLMNSCFWGSLPEGGESYVGDNASGTIINCYDTLSDDIDRLQTEEFLDELNLTSKRNSLTSWEFSNNPYPTPLLSHEVILKSFNNGYITSDKSSAYKDTKVTITVHPNTKYKIKSINISGVKLKKIRNNVYQFTMPDEAIIVRTTLKKK